MTFGMLLFAGAVAVVVGVLIGAIGIGGVLLVPMLTYVLGISIHVAIATAMFSCVKKDGKSACTPDLGVGPCATPRQASQSRLTGSVRAGALRCAGSRNRAWKKM